MMSVQRFAMGLLLVLGLVASSSAQQFVLAFDDLAAPNAQVGESYAPQGVHFALTDTGLQDGTGYTDSGGWGIAGTRGSWFEGFNGNPSYDMTLTFDRPIEGFALDVSRSAGSADGDTFTLSAFQGSTQVDTQMVTLPAINTWATVSSSASGIDRVEWTGNGMAFHPYGVDNIRFTVVPTQIDRFKCYKAKDRKDPAKFAGAQVTLEDGLETKITDVRKPIAYCEPVNEDGAGTVNPQARLVCYKIKDAKTHPKQAKFDKRQLVAADGFGELSLLLSKSTTLCEPATEVP